MNAAWSVVYSRSTCLYYNIVDAKRPEIRIFILLIGIFHILEMWSDKLKNVLPISLLSEKLTIIGKPSSPKMKIKPL